MSALERLQDSLLLSQEELNAALVFALAAAGDLNWSPKKNWIENEGGLPRGIRDMAIHIMENSGLSREHAIAAAIERAKKLAAMGKPRWVKEVAEWEAKKAHTHMKASASEQDSLELAAKPYGNVAYADPKNGKYPIDTEAHCRAAWSYINMPRNASKYPLNGVTLSQVKARIRAACKKFGVEIS